MNRLVDTYLKHVVRRGALDVRWSSGRETRYGEASGRPIRLVCEVLFEDSVVYRTGDSNPFFKVATAFFSRYLKAVLVGD